MFGRRKIEEEIRARLDPDYMPPPRRSRIPETYLAGGLVLLTIGIGSGVVMMIKIFSNQEWGYMSLMSILFSGLSIQAFSQAVVVMKLDRILEMQR